MNLLFRLVWTLLYSRFSPRIGILEECRTPFWVALNDLDPYFHMNNGRYFTLQDLARLDLMMRMGAAKTITARGWYPVVASETMRFKKSLKLFQRFEISSRVLSWDERCFYIEHRWTRGGETLAHGLIRARFLKKSGGGVAPSEGMAALGHTAPAPAFPNYLTQWISSENEQAKLFSK